MKTIERPSAAARCVAASLVGSLLTSLSHAVELADSPMTVANYASPNILFTLDDSGSMNFAYSHESAMLEVIDGDYIPHMDKLCTKNHFANNQFYNPNRKYLPGMFADGTSAPQSNFTGARVHGYDITYEYYTSLDTSQIDYYPSKSYEAYRKGYDDGTIVNKPSSSGRGTISEPRNPVNDLEYASPRHKAAYNQGYTDASQSRGNNENQYRHAFYKRFGNKVTNRTGVDLSRNFQAYFDHGGRTFLIDRSSGRRVITHRPIWMSNPEPAFYTRYRNGTPSKTGQCYPDDQYEKVVITTDEEKQNFANWFTYHRTRLLAMQTAVSTAFAGLGSNSLVGFAVLNNNARFFLPIERFELTGSRHKVFWYDNLFDIKPSGSTPLIDAAIRAGEYFEAGIMPMGNGMSADDNMFETSTAVKDDSRLRKELSIGACQRNIHILSSDGYTSDMPKIASVGNTDKTVPSLPVSQSYNPITQKMEAGVFDPVAGKMLTPGSQFPPPYYDNAAGDGNFLSDVAMRYWIRDLRPGVDNRVPPTERNPATWQNLTLHTVGFGIEGTVLVNKDAENKLISGELGWPNLVLENQTMLDDMWHAAFNGHGQHFTATDARGLQEGLQEVLAEVTSFDVGSAPVAISNPDLASNESTGFLSGYRSGIWSGSLVAHPIDTKTGTVNTNQTLWSGENLLDKKNWTTRYIGSYSGSTGVAFNTGSLTGQQLQRLNTPGANDHADVINFLRGDTSKEGKNYRRRGSRLGDIVNAAPLYVGPPSAKYSDAGYTKFKDDRKERAPMVYQGANDGMLHAFNANTGEEQWAYVPGRLIAQDYVIPAKKHASTSTLVNLSLNRGFNHRYYVDGTPVAADVDFGNTADIANRGKPDATSNWKTLLVGGLNKGGRGYYALDVTLPGASSDAEVANKVKWEFPRNDTDDATARNVGFSFGKPIIVKTEAAGWVVLVSSGYNNGKDTGGDGQAYLFVLDAATGKLIKALPTNVGSSDTPSGLAHVSAYVEFGNLDRTVEYAYGGDLLGNVWRFDLTGKSDADWNVKKLATLTDAGGNPQPITTAPELTKYVDKRLVLVGTGQYLGLSDVPGNTSSNAHASQAQSFYVMTDDESAKPTITSPRSQLAQQTITIHGNTAESSQNPVDLATKRGWYFDFPHAAERAVTHPFVVRGVVAFTSNIPGSDTCMLGGSSWLYVLNVKDGKPPKDVVGKFLGTALASEVVPVRQQKSGAIQGIIRKSDGTTSTEELVTPKVNPPQRKMWREILRN